MTAELPHLDLANATECSAPKQTSSRLKVKSAIETRRSKCDDDNDLSDSTNHRRGKRNSDGSVLQVTFADDVAVVDVERKKAVVGGSNSSIHVDHKHYEQWARVPSTAKKLTKSTLLRGIQQLKARMKRDDTNMEIVGLGKVRTGSGSEQRSLRPLENKNYQIKELRRNILLTSEKISELEKAVPVRRDRVNLGVENAVSKNVGLPRNELKPNSQLIDSGVFKQENDITSPLADIDVRLNRNPERDSAKLRHGMSRIRDRSAFPISVYQPVSIGDHVFLINEPVKDSELLPLKKTEYRVSKNDTQTPSMLLLADKSKGNEVLKKARELHVHLDMLLGGKSGSVTSNFQRSRTAAGALLPSRIQRRTQFEVSNAELYDFSQLSEIRHSMADKFMERSHTELLFPNKSIRHGYRMYNE